MGKEEEQGIWGFKALKQMMKLLFSMSEFQEFTHCYTQLLGELLLLLLLFLVVLVVRWCCCWCCCWWWLLFFPEVDDDTLVLHVGVPGVYGVFYAGVGWVREVGAAFAVVRCLLVLVVRVL